MPAHAYSVTVVASRPVEEQVIPRMEAIKDVLGNILSTQTATGTAINQNSEKLASVIAQNGQATRQQMIFSNETQRLEEARKSFTVPDSICSESASGIATESKSASASAASKLSKGGGVSNRSIRDRLTSAANSPVREAYDGAYHTRQLLYRSRICTFWRNRRLSFCGRNTGGDSQVRSIYHGAGTADTPAALTWDQKQIDAATAYMKNTSRPSAGRALGKGEVNTQSGRTYVGLQNEYNGIIDSASNPQLTLIADSTPNESTRKALAETLQSDSAVPLTSTGGFTRSKSTGIYEYP
uniref:conjugal transfer protein TraW n=1 Tax=Escherichia coli TaxID=562 RepID=UPI001F5F6FD6|nr:conjugal transfer protein TraW [Escherichia coli]